MVSSTILCRSPWHAAALEQQVTVCALGKNVRHLFAPVLGAVVNPDRIIKFFRMRLGPDGEPISNLIGYPEATGGPWYRCAWLSYSENIYGIQGI